MKRISRVKLIEKIIDLHGFISDCEKAELNAYNKSTDSDIKDIHHLKGNTFQFVKEFIQVQFRPLV